MDVLDGIDIDSNIADTKLRLHEDELYSKAINEAEALDQTDKDSLDKWINSDSVKEYFDLSGNNAIWVPSDTGDNVTGYFKNGGIYTGSADKGIRTGEGKWEYGGKTYTGSWKGDKPDGTGTYGFPHSNYTGNFEDGKGNGSFEAVWETAQFLVNVSNGEMQTLGQETIEGKVYYIICQNGSHNYDIDNPWFLVVDGIE